jgi:hypothetical protein
MTSKPHAILSRRKLLAGLTVSAVGLGAVAAQALNRTWFSRDARGSRSWWSRQYASLDNGGMNEWSRHVGSEFQVRTGSGAEAMKLVSVQPLTSKGARPAGVSRDRAFAAVFEGGSGQAPGDRIYDVNHKEGAMKIYFSLADPTSSTIRLQAVFN